MYSLDIIELLTCIFLIIFFLNDNIRPETIEGTAVVLGIQYLLIQAFLFSFFLQTAEVTLILKKDFYSALVSLAAIQIL